MDVNRHKAFLKFLSRLADVSGGYTLDDLRQFQHIAERDFPAIIPTLLALMHLATRTSTDVDQKEIWEQLSTKRSSRARKMAANGNHLFDMLRSRTLFPMNNDLADFAARILPGMTRKRFDKMSRGDIAARIIEYLESREPRRRQRLEHAMQNAIVAMKSGVSRPSKEDFQREWEDIIKGSKI